MASWWDGYKAKANLFKDTWLWFKANSSSHTHLFEEKKQIKKAGMVRMESVCVCVRVRVC